MNVALGSYVFNRSARRVTTQAGAGVWLSTRQFDVLAVLVAKDGQPATFDDLAAAYPVVPEDLVQAVRDQVMKLRRRLPLLEIYSVLGVGYRVDACPVVDFTLPG